LSPQTPFKDIEEETIEKETREQFKHLKLKINNGMEITEPDQIPREVHNEKHSAKEIPLTLDDALTSVGQIIDPEVKPSSVQEIKETEYGQLDDDDENENSPPKNKEFSSQNAIDIKPIDLNQKEEEEEKESHLKIPGRKSPQRPNLRMAFQLKQQEEIQKEENSPSVKEEEEEEEDDDDVGEKKEYLNLSGGDDFLNLDDEMKSPVYEDQNSPVEIQSKKGKIVSENEIGAFWLQNQESKREELGFEKNKSNPVTQGSLRRNLFLQGGIQTREKPSENLKFNFQSAEEEGKLEEAEADENQNILNIQNDDNALSKKLRNLAKSQFKGDSGIEPERSVSIPSKENLTEKGTPGLIEEAGFEMLIGSKQKEKNPHYREKKLYYSGLTNSQGEEEHKDHFHQEIGEFQFDALLGSKSRNQEKNPTIPKSRNPQSRKSIKLDSLPEGKSKGINLEKEEEKEWESTFDINKNSHLQTRQNSRGEIPSNPNLEGSLLSGQEINSDNLKNFIYNEVAKSIFNFFLTQSINNYQKIKLIG